MVWCGPLLPPMGGGPRKPPPPPPPTVTKNKAKKGCAREEGSPVEVKTFTEWLRRRQLW
jgi:hypothetical protein